MHSWKDVQQRLFLGRNQRTGSGWHTARKVALLTNAVGRAEAARSAEILQLVNRLKHLLQELGPCPPVQASQLLSEGLDQKEVTFEPAALENSKPLIRAGQESTSRDRDQSLAGKEETQAPVYELVPDLELLDIEEGFEREDSWLVGISNEAEGQGSEEDVVQDSVEKAYSGSSAQECESAKEKADESRSSCRKTGEEAQLHLGVGKRMFNLSQVWTFATTAIKSSVVEKSVGRLRDLQTASDELQKVRDERAVTASFLIRRARDLSARKRSAAEKLSMQVGRNALAEEEELPREALDNKEPELQEQTGTPGWLSVESIQLLAESVRQLEASMAATCQEMEGSLRALWDLLGEPLESREALEAQGKALDIEVRHRRLELALEEAEKKVTMLQHIACLYQQRDDLRGQSQSQELICRDASKQLLSRKADGASALRKAEADKKRLAKQSAWVTERLDQALRAWEAQTGKAFDRRLQSVCTRLASEPASLLKSGPVTTAEKGRTPGSCTTSTALSTSELEPVLVPLLENVV